VPVGDFAVDIYYRAGPAGASHYYQEILSYCGYVRASRMSHICGKSVDGICGTCRARIRTLQNMSKKWLGLLFLVFAALRTWGLDPVRGLTQFGIERWSNREGLPQDKVKALGQTSDGYLWIGTQAGLARFDGVRFVKLTTPELPLLEIHRSHSALSRWSK
jgi:hypothetical protein